MKQTRKPTSLEWEYDGHDWWLSPKDCDVRCRVFPMIGEWGFWIMAKSFRVKRLYFKSPKIAKCEARKLFNRLFIHGEIFEELRAIEAEARKVREWK